MVYLHADAEIPISSRSYLVLVLMSAASILWLPYPCLAGELISRNCSRGGQYSSGSTYKFNLDILLDKMRQESSKTGFYEHTEGTGGDQVYGSYLCQGDLSNHNCSQCVQSAVTGILTNCSNQIKAKIWYDECILQYSDEPFSGSWQIDYITWCGYGKYIQPAQFDQVLSDTLTKAARLAAADQTPNRKFATMEVNLTFVQGSPTLYTLAQCVPNLSPDICLQCLDQSITYDLPGWCNRTQSGRTLCSSCIIRYDMNRFYSDQVPILAPASAPAPSPTRPTELPPLISVVLHPPKGASVLEVKRRPSRVLEIVGLLTVVAMLVTLGIGIWCCNCNNNSLNGFEDIDMEEITSAESLQLDFTKIRASTQNFAPDRKLGEGGFGDVYKGKLENGQEIAVKRLSLSNSGQGAAEFKNEVVLVAKLQHRNLVKLLGFCLTGKEKILVYEYLPNSSLDKVLFDPIKRASLDWEKRFNIICGIAKGLLYLHQDSRLRIIHRDLKSSNILLDEAMNAKISDFGVAKMLALDQTRASTDTLAGTYAYMAPEYMMIGQYSLKSDMYSFGIIVLEIVTGQRNRFCGRPLLEEALLHRAWRLWSENAVLEMVDSALNDAYSTEDVVKCIHIGLLCIQMDAGKRPTMTSVVAALSGKSMDLPAPTPPNFLDTSYSFSTTTTTTTPTGSTHASFPTS